MKYKEVTRRLRSLGCEFKRQADVARMKFGGIRENVNLRSFLDMVGVIFPKALYAPSCDSLILIPMNFTNEARNDERR